LQGATIKKSPIGRIAASGQPASPPARQPASPFYGSELDLFQIILCVESLSKILVAFLQQRTETIAIRRRQQIRWLACNNTLIYKWVGAWIGYRFRDTPNG
jgi:hypothetical protein